MTTAVAEKTIESRIASRFGVQANEVATILKQTAFKVKGQEPVTDAQMKALMIVADQYKLNPFTKELYAYPDKNNGIVPVVSVDGWTRIINEHPMMNGLEFEYAEQTEKPKESKDCPVWCEAIIYRKDREKPTRVREHLDEVFLPPRGGYSGPWQTHTKRMLRHKTLIQCARIAFGFAGIYDEDEAARIVEREVRGEVLGEEAANQTNEKPPRTEEQFAHSLETKWKPAIERGAKTAQDVIQLAETKAPLTDEQRERILAIQPPKQEAA
jgi:phage recombination protein Bet